MKNTQWTQKAACRGVYNPNAFFPENSRDMMVTKRAVTLCKKECPVQLQCLLFGLKEHDGFWGGYNRQERKRIRRRMQSHGEAIEAIMQRMNGALTQ